MNICFSYYLWNQFRLTSMYTIYLPTYREITNISGNKASIYGSAKVALVFQVNQRQVLLVLVSPMAKRKPVNALEPKPSPQKKPKASEKERMSHLQLNNFSLSFNICVLDDNADSSPTKSSKKDKPQISDSIVGMYFMHFVVFADSRTSGSRCY